MEINRCPSCGALIEATQEGFVTCSYCGAKVYVNGKGQIEITSEHSETVLRKKNNKPFILILVVLAIALITALCVVANKYNTDKAEEEIVVPEETGETYAISDIEKVEVGDTLILGKFEQDNVSSTSEDIEWLVLANNGEQLTLISKYGLDHVKYNDIDSWLSDKLLKGFTDSEKEYLSDIKVLDYARAESLFESNEKRACEATAYAIANGVHTYENSNLCWWWLKTEDLVNGPHNVRTDGHIKFVDTKIDDEGYAIRPSISVTIEPNKINAANWNKDNSGSSNTKQETKAQTIIEVLDETMNVYTTVDKSSPKNGKVYKGDRFVCLQYYETPGYKWYQIGTNQWLGDGNDTRIGLVSGELKSVDSVVKEVSTAPADKKEQLVSKIHSLGPFVMDSANLYAYYIYDDESNALCNILGGESINCISFSSDIYFDFSNTKINVKDDNKTVEIYVYLYGDTFASNIVSRTIKYLNVNYYDSYSYTYIEYPNDDIKNVIGNMKGSFDYYAYNGENIKQMKEIIESAVKDIYPDYSVYVGFKD